MIQFIKNSRKHKLVTKSRSRVGWRWAEGPEGEATKGHRKLVRGTMGTVHCLDCGGDLVNVHTC